MYAIGEYIVHPMHGAGIIEDITEERLIGVKASYYVFHMKICSLLLKIPTENSDTIGIRPLSTVEQMDQIMQALPIMEVENDPNWNRRYRENMERLKSGDLYEVARVIKGLMFRDSQRTLSNGERKMLHNAKQILLSELSVVWGITYAEAEGRLTEIVLGDHSNDIS